MAMNFYNPNSILSIGNQAIDVNFSLSPTHVILDESLSLSNLALGHYGLIEHTVTKIWPNLPNVNALGNIIVTEVTKTSHFLPSTSNIFHGLNLDERAILGNLDALNKFNCCMNQERDHPSPYRNQPMFNRTTCEEVLDDDKTHSLANYPKGTYGCPKCFTTCYSSQAFAAHIHAHYKHESKEERKRRMIARCRRMNLGVARSRHGLIGVPAKTFEVIAKGRNNVKKRSGLKNGDLNPGVAVEGATVKVKEEPIN